MSWDSSSGLLDLDSMISKYSFKVPVNLTLSLLLVLDSCQVSREVKSVQIGVGRPRSRPSPMEASGKVLA